MYAQQRQSGLVVVTDKRPEQPKPPEHPVRAVIRKWLQSLPAEFAGFEQTTHGHINLEQDIGDVLKRVAEAYDRPEAFTISEASQAIEHFFRGREDG